MSDALTSYNEKELKMMRDEVANLRSDSWSMSLTITVSFLMLMSELGTSEPIMLLCIIFAAVGAAAGWMLSFNFRKVCNMLEDLSRGQESSLADTK